MKKIILDNNEYELIEDNGDCFSDVDIKDKYTDYFYEFDYILGDYAYNKINDYNTKADYLKKLCAYKCKYFVLKKVKSVEKQ